MIQGFFFQLQKDRTNLNWDGREVGRVMVNYFCHYQLPAAALPLPAQYSVTGQWSLVNAGILCIINYKYKESN